MKCKLIFLCLFTVLGTVKSWAQCVTPTNIVASSPDNTETIDWNWDNDPAATKYTLQYRLQGNSFTSVTITTNSYNLTGQTQGTYEYRIRANCGSWTSFSSIASFTLGSGIPDGTCDTPTNLAATSTATSISLTWDDMSASKYQVQYRPQGGSFTSAVPTTNSYTIDGLSSGVYEYRVRSYCGSWTSFTSIMSITVGTGTTPPSSGLWTDASTHIYYDGDVLIGTEGTALPSGYNLYVEDGILTEKAKVALVSTSSWSDYVFEEDYILNSLEEVENYIKLNKHLPHVPSATQVKKNGIDVATMDATLLRQIEELWLHLIEMKKENDTLKMKVLELAKK